ncbi:MAG: protein phosphatase 2C domain-containing protein [Oscillospiraceae bacterium]
MLFIQASCCFNQGNVRGNNEDNFAFDGKLLPLNDRQEGRLSLKKPLWARHVSMGVFDGMGGLHNGEDASRLAAKKFVHRMRYSVFLPGDGTDCLRHACYAMNETVCDFSERCKQAAGTTAVLLLFSKGVVAMSNVGDSRAYLFREGSLQQLSEEHSDKALLEQLGGDRSPSLWQYIGLSRHIMPIEPYSTTIRYQRGDRYLLCSDGLTGMVQDKQIAELCGQSGSADDCANRLVECALLNGGKDNITVIVCDIK